VTVRPTLLVEGKKDVETAIDKVGDVTGAKLLPVASPPGPVVDALAVTPRMLPAFIQNLLLAFPSEASKGSAVNSHRTQAPCRAS
jgi:hypothetical protein